jgi:hypothetical protein
VWVLGRISTLGEVDFVDSGYIYYNVEDSEVVAKGEQMRPYHVVRQSELRCGVWRLKLFADFFFKKKSRKVPPNRRCGKCIHNTHVKTHRNEQNKGSND